MTSRLCGAALAALMSSAALLTLTACDGGPASKPARDQASASSASVATIGDGAGADSARPDAVDHRKDPVAQVDGAPIWANSKKYAAEESAAYHFKRDGADFDAKTEADYVAKAHAFVTKPPKGVLTLARSNGDKLLYDPKKNIFAVVTKDGAPRTMFKPDAGQAYWDQQVERQKAEAKGDDGGGEKRYSRRSSHRSDDEGDG